MKYWFEFAVPTAALAALHALRDVTKVQPGQKVLINGASGGVGSFAVQIAKSFGVDVTGVCSASNVDMVRSLSDCRRALKPTGTLILNSGTGARGITMVIRLIKPLLMSPFVRQNLRRYLSVPNHKDLNVLKELVESGQVQPVIDKTYSLDEVAEALAYIDGGHVRGKVVVGL